MNVDLDSGLISSGVFTVIGETTSVAANYTMLQEAIDIATLATSYYSDYADIARYIKMVYDNRYDPFWIVLIAPLPNGVFYTYSSPYSIRLRWRNSVDIYIAKPYQYSMPKL